MTVPPSNDTHPAPSAAIELARANLARLPACFWMRQLDADLKSVADVELVIQRLRQHGNRAAWNAALEIERCL